MDTEQQPPAKSFWTVGHVTLLVLGSVVAIAGIVVVVAVLCRAHNYNAQQIALRRTAESKQLADARHKSLDAPTAIRSFGSRSSTNSRSHSGSARWTMCPVRRVPSRTSS